ncbi:putative eukaryotic translation initiation factor 4 gamma like protein [Nosema granulosis]|uniref:Eukaryotic translation initiation factor 4 gamma like protein n=1 Tax=Nosema granulosis TaxID=83296 RepID=A0A9P6GWT8_9MICR|nr:putative eukaryotic translation initiation factor 4 gamma like protein [Nosema granulosis]
MNMINSKEENQVEYIKRIVYRSKKAKITISRRQDNPYGPRVKSAPPISIIKPVEKVEEKKHILLKPDGTPLTLEDLEDVTDSSEVDEECIDTKNNVTENNVTENNVTENDVIENNVIENNVIENNVIENNVIENNVTENNVTENNVIENNVEDKTTSTTTLPTEFVMPFKENPFNYRCLNCYSTRRPALAYIKDRFKPKDTTNENTKNKTTKTENTFSISEILQCKERSPFSLNLLKKKEKDKKIDKRNESNYIIDKNRKDTVVELARLELNKLTSSNFNLVVSKLKALNLQTVGEAKEIANILLEKAIEEPTFTQLYAKVVGELKKVLRSKEELSMNVKQTAFFGTLLTRAFSIVCENVAWADPTFEIHLSDFANRFLYEQKIEDMEEIRYKRKHRTLGAITFISHLYIENIISFTKIGERIEELIKDPHFESVEVLCSLISNIGEKLMKSNKEQIVTRVFNHLNSIKKNYELRVQFLIEATFETRKKWKKASTSVGNRFASLEIEEVAPQPVKKEDSTSKILSFISSISSELQDSCEDDEKIVVADNFSRGSNLFGKTPFFSLYLSEAISDFKKSKFLIPFFVDFFSRTGLVQEELVDLLKSLRENLKELKIDFPKSSANYVELLALLKVRGILSGHYEDLKSPDWNIKSKEIIKKWNSSEDLKEKIKEAFPEEN